jgi:hypothetical protein
VSTRRTIVINGVEYAPRDCDWVVWSPSGEPVGCSLVRSPAYDDPGKAARQFWGTATEAMNHLARGYRLELMTHERWAAEVMPLMLSKPSDRAGAGS